MEEKVQEEAKGRIRFRLEYDFTLQELKVTVREKFNLEYHQSCKESPFGVNDVGRIQCQKILTDYFLDPISDIIQSEPFRFLKIFLILITIFENYPACCIYVCDISH